MQRRAFLFSTALAISTTAAPLLASPVSGSPKVELLSDGTRFAIIKAGKGASPTLFHFATTDVQSLSDPSFGVLAATMAAKGWSVVSIDVPCHGADAREGEPPELAGWRFRNDRSESITESFVAKCSRVLSHLISTGQADPKRSFASGISRGAFCALRMAEADARISGIAALAPVTDLTALAEFDGIASPIDRIDPRALTSRSLLIAMALNDPRVSTEKALTLSRAIAASAAPGETDIEVHLKEVHGHVVDPSFVQKASEWLQQTSER